MTIILTPLVVTTQEAEEVSKYNKPLKALASLAGTATRRLCRFAPNFSLRVTAP